MDKQQRENLRADLERAAPVTVRFHGSPRNAPSLRTTGVGCLAFRSWNRVFVSVSPSRPLVEAEVSALVDAIRPWDGGGGLSVLGGPDGWPSA